MSRSYVKIREDLSFFLFSIKIFGKCTKRLKVRKSNPTLRSYHLCTSDLAGILHKLPGKLHYLYIMQAIWCPVCYIISKGNQPVPDAHEILMVFSKDWYERRKFVGVIIRINRVPQLLYFNNFFFSLQHPSGQRKKLISPKTKMTGLTFR